MAVLASVVFAIALISGQLGIWGLGIAGSGGPERYVRGKTDLIATLTGALMIRTGDGSVLYDLTAQHDYQQRALAPYINLDPEITLPYLHPPFESLLVALLMDLPYPVIFGLWTLLELAALAASLWILATVLPGDRTVRWTMTALACAYYPVHAMLWLGQSSSLLLLGLCGAYAALKHRHDTWAGLALALLAITANFINIGPSTSQRITLPQAEFGSVSMKTAVSRNSRYLSFCSCWCNDAGNP